jgi:carbonic anhydrase
MAKLQRDYAAEGALERLKQGNERFVSGRARLPTIQKEVLAELAKGQQACATVLG